MKYIKLFEKQEIKDQLLREQFLKELVKIIKLVSEKDKLRRSKVQLSVMHIKFRKLRHYWCK